ncbi:MAG: sulfotransferase, partial [Deltaproteobacteria bacterium]|nr:sulfotransferase [Deltaproteobacteria bacterium]
MGELFTSLDLVDGAVRETGLGDFGAGAWRDGLDALVEMSLAEADLNLVGLGILKSWSHRRLVNRLRVVDWVKRHPEVRDERIERPIFVLGMLRTGTTILCELLACDPANRPLMKWEGLESVPPPRRETFTTDPRIAQMVETVEFQMSMVPELRAVHYEPGDGPTECVALLTQAFRAQDLACGIFQSPSYAEWYRGCDFGPAYDYHHL